MRSEQAPWQNCVQSYVLNVGTTMIKDDMRNQSSGYSILDWNLQFYVKQVNAITLLVTT
jgi:hypothetical protein